MEGLYSLLDKYRFENDPRFIYEGLYQDPMSNLATANPLKALLNPNFDFRSPSSIERYAKEGATNLSGYVPTDYDRAMDFKRLFEDRPLKATDGAMRFQDFNPRVGITSNLTSQSDRQVTPFKLLPQRSNIRSSQDTITDDQAPFFFPSNNFSEVLSAVEDDDLEESAIPEFAEGQLKQSPTGIARLFQLLGNIPTPFNLARRGLESLRGFNDRIRNTAFGQSRTGAEFAMRRREQKQADRAREAMPNVYRDAANVPGALGRGGGFSSSFEDRAGTSLGSGQFPSKRSTGRQGY